MPRRTFEQKWEELRREGKLKDMIAESQQDFERSQAIEPPEVEVTTVQQAVPARAGRGTPTSSRFAQEVLARSRAALRMPVPVSTADSEPDPFYNFDKAFLEDDEDEPEPDVEDFDGDNHEVTIPGDAWADDAVANDDDDEVDYATVAAASMHTVMDNVLNETVPWKD